MRLNLFIRRGLFYLPVSLIGWLICIAAITYSVYIFIDIDSRSHSVSDTLINFVFNLLLIGLAYTLVASLAVRKPANG